MTDISETDEKLTQIGIFEERHINDIVQAEKRCFSVPLDENTVIELAIKLGRGFVLYENEALAAYGFILTAGGEGEITRVATLPEFRRRGYSRLIISRIEDEARSLGFSRILLEVRESNTAARTLYKTSGYKETGVRRGYYTMPREDAIVMEKQT